MKRYWFIAVLLHVALITLLLVKFDWWRSEPPQAPSAIQAVVVDGATLSRQERQSERDSAEQERKRVEQERHRQETAKKREQERLREAEERRRKEHQLQREKAEQLKRIELEKQKLREQEQRRKAEEAKRKKAEQEKRRLEEVERKKAEEEKRRKAEEARRRKAEAERRRKAAERKRREEALKSQLAAEEEFLEGEAQRKNQALVARYMARIREKVESRWLEPPTARPGMSCTVRIRLSSAGDVLVVVTTASSGDTVFDRSVEAAVQKASPLPLPPDPALLPGFPELKFKFEKKE